MNAERLFALYDRVTNQPKGSCLAVIRARSGNQGKPSQLVCCGHEKRVRFPHSGSIFNGSDKSPPYQGSMGSVPGSWHCAVWNGRRPGRRMGCHDRMGWGILPRPEDACRRARGKKLDRGGFSDPIVRAFGLGAFRTGPIGSRDCTERCKLGLTGEFSRPPRVRVYSSPRRLTPQNRCFSNQPRTLCSA